MNKILLYALLSLNLSAYALTQSEVKVYVQDQDGKPVSGATVTFSFDRPDIDHPKHVVVQTDTNGFATVSDKALTRTYVLVEKAGYYDTSIWKKDYKFGEREWKATHHLVLKERRNPIPMFVKKVFMKIPDAKMPRCQDAKMPRCQLDLIWKKPTGWLLMDQELLRIC